MKRYYLMIFYVFIGLICIIAGLIYSCENEKPQKVESIDMVQQSEILAKKADSLAFFFGATIAAIILKDVYDSTGTLNISFDEIVDRSFEMRNNPEEYLTRNDSVFIKIW